MSSAQQSNEEKEKVLATALELGSMMDGSGSNEDLRRALDWLTNDDPSHPDERVVQFGTALAALLEASVTFARSERR